MNLGYQRNLDDEALTKNDGQSKFSKYDNLIKSIYALSKDRSADTNEDTKTYEYNQLNNLDTEEKKRI